MTAPNNHYLTITLPDGKHVRARVVYLQPKEERWSERSAAVHIACSEWLEPYWYKAIYATPDASFGGQFMPTRYEMADAHDWLFKGSFERDK